jgi:hypothetical protein
MLRKSRFFLLTLAFSSLIVSSAFAHPRHASFVSTPSCDQNHIYSYDEGYPEHAFAQEEHALPAGSFTRLDVESFRNNGVSLVGWSQPGAKLVVCKFSAGTTKAEANELLSELKVEISGGKISGSGPADNHAWMQFILYVPANVTAAARSTNGPVAVSGASGTFNLETENGPINLDKVSGAVTARAENGPIGVSESSGDINLRTVNGPISVALESGQWQGKGLEASAKNGPVSISVPEGYRSGVEISMSGNAPVECSHCDITQTYRERSIHLGAKDAPVLVHLSTVNGPVEIGSAAEMSDEMD